MAKSIKEPSCANIDFLIKETSNYEIIGREAENACFRIYHTEGVPPSVKEAAKLKVIQSNLRFALQFAIDYHAVSGLPVEDFYGDCKLGLMEAFYKFDWTKGVKFDSYAIWYLRTRVGNTINENDVIRVPVRLRKKILELSRKNGDVNSVKYGQEAEAAIFHTFSMDLPLDKCEDDDGAPLTVADTIPDERMESLPDVEHRHEVMLDTVNRSIDRVLNPDESKLIRHIYGLDREESSLEDVAMEFGNSKDWARRVKSRALAKLRNSHALDDFAKGN